MSSHSKIILVDEKMNTIVLELSTTQLQILGVTKDKIKKHKSRRQLNLSISEYLKNSEK